MSDKFNNPWDDNGKNKGNIDDMLKKSQDKFIEFLKQKGGNQRKKNNDDGGDGFGFNFGDVPTKKIIALVGLVLLFLWLSTGFYTIGTDEEGVVMRFGSYSRTSPAGLNYKLPAPIETVTKISVTRINKEEVGFRSSGQRITTREMLLKNTVSNESQILTTDENIVDINFEVQWLISDAKNFLFNVRDLQGENTVRNVAESAMREVIGLEKINDVLAEERSRIEVQARNLMQSMLDNYGMGVKVVRVQLLRVDPPQEVIDAYRDVQNAKQDKEREINQALAYRNDIVPRARGEAEQLIQNAEGYKQKVIAEAQGEAQRFTSVYSQYVTAKDVTRKRMYLETMEEILDGMNKFVLDNKSSSSVVPYLALPELEKRNVKTTAKE